MTCFTLLQSANVTVTNRRQFSRSTDWRHIHCPSFGKGENKGSVLLWYSCFDRSILMFLKREGLQCRISILKHCLMRLWIDINQLNYPPLPKLGQLSGCDVSWPRELWNVIIIILCNKSEIAVNCRFVQKLIDLRQWWTILRILMNFILTLW